MSASEPGSTENVVQMTEEQLREAPVPWPKTREELDAYINALVERPHDYGTCVYAMSMAATAAFQYVANRLGVTGFQASCADLDILRRTRSMKMGFRLQNYENLLYPQYCDEAHFPTWQQLMREQRPELAKAAREKLQETDGFAHPDVIAHWKRLAEAS